MYWNIGHRIEKEENRMLDVTSTNVILVSQTRLAFLAQAALRGNNCTKYLYLLKNIFDPTKRNIEERKNVLHLVSDDGHLVKP